MTRNKEMSTKQLYRGGAGWYLVQYPADWVAEESEDLVTFYRPETGIGALQISAFRTPGQHDTPQVLSEYLLEQNLPDSDVKIIDQQDGTKMVSSFNYMEADSYWHAWVISQGSHLLFVTYNCEAANKEQELDPVLDIVSSIRIQS